MVARRFIAKTKLRLTAFLLLLIITAIAVSQSPGQTQQTQGKSDYAIHSWQDFNRPDFYPISQIPPAKLYQPIADWIGRLILPTKQQLEDGRDWVWLEVQQAPVTQKNLIGKTVRLEWKNNQEILAYIQAITRDVSFTQETIASQTKGMIHPSRLNGVRQVGALRSLAGASPNDDAIVILDNPTVVTASEGKVTLQIEDEPVLATGRFYSLVKIIKPDVKSQHFRVRHYNPSSNNFDGKEEIIRIPQQVIDTRNIPPSTLYQIEKSPAGLLGWYIYGGIDKKGIFTAQALAPRTLFQLTPHRTITDEGAKVSYIHSRNWQNTPANKGKLNSILLTNTSQQPWILEDKAIVLHLFGGIGGRKAEALGVPGTITGHFAFGFANIIRDSFTNELRFDIKYHQVYAHNPNGIIAGTHTWANYMGNLESGWLATRPVSDILIKFDPVTKDYDFDSIKLSPIEELQQQLQMTMARYRIGDGTGNATVSPATSCVQDSSQALYATILAIKNKVATTPQISTWLEKHPQHPQSLRFQQLIALGESLEKQLVPLGIVRADWESQASILAGTGTGETTKPFQDGSIWAGLTTWRTMMPRQVQDDLATIFLQHGATLQVLRTNQVGGWQPDISPIAPTAFFGLLKIPFTDVSVLPVILNRILASLAIPTGRDWLVVFGALLIYSIIALPIGFRCKFVQVQVRPKSWQQKCFVILQGLFFPAISEELCFRVLLLPHPIEMTNWWVWILWAIFSIFLFVIYHPLNAITFFKVGNPTFLNPVFLGLAGLLGIACTLAYAMTGSLWVVVMIHWVVVVVWLILLGGVTKLSGESF